MKTLHACVLAMGCMMVFGAQAQSVAPATGLGMARPNAIDVSTNPNYHVYLFTLGGVRYIQVNDVNGNVMGAVGTASGQFITLPVGAFAQQVSTPQQAPAAPSTAAPSTAPITVYNDGSVLVTATPMNDGTTALRAAPSAVACDPIDCNLKGP
ncbi:MAG: hypothetical protein RSP_00830 [Rhodanobacter sp.]